MYIGSIILGICTVVIARFFLYNFIQKLEDKESCSMGLDCSEGSIEFYEKLINRNKILRDTLVDGASYFDKEGKQHSINNIHNYLIKLYELFVSIKRKLYDAYYKYTIYK